MIGITCYARKDTTTYVKLSRGIFTGVKWAPPAACPLYAFLSIRVRLIRDQVRTRAAGLVDVVRRAGHPSEFTFPSTTPAKCIDYIWTNNRLTGVPGAARVLFEAGFRTNPADPRSFALSDHLPVMAELTWL
jgi:hypothetical protein